MSEFDTYLRKCLKDPKLTVEYIKDALKEDPEYLKHVLKKVSTIPYSEEEKKYLLNNICKKAGIEWILD